MVSRLNRLFKQRSNGTYKVPEEIVQKCKTSDGKDEIIREFKKQGYDKDCIAANFISFLQSCKISTLFFNVLLSSPHVQILQERMVNSGWMECSCPRRT